MATKTTNLGLSKAELTDAVRSTLIANNDNFDKIDEAYAEVNETIHAKEQALQGQIDRLRANQIQGTASGTEVIVQDSAEMESVLKLSGNSEQDSRSGKNKLDIELSGGTNGLNITVNEDKTITLNGTTTGGGSIYISKPVILKANTNNTISSKVVSGTTTSVPSVVCWNSIISKWHFEAKVGNAQTKQYTEDFESRIALYVTTGVVYENYTIAVQLEEGTVATDYEPYGVQPSPDYPSEIRSVKSKSDNLFPLPNTSTKNGITFTNNEDGTFNLSGTATALTVFYVISPNEESNINVGEQYTIYSNFSKTVKVQDTTNGAWHSDLIVYQNGNTALTKKIGETVGNAILFAIEIPNGTTINETNCYIMLNKGDKVLPYQPYGYVPVELKVEGKNLALIASVYSSVEYKLIDGVVTFNGTNSSASSHTFYFNKKELILKKGKTYTISVICKGNINASGYKVCYFNGNKVKDNAWVSKELGTLGNNKTLTLQYTPSEDVFAQNISFDMSTNTTFTNYEVKIQIEEGSEATLYTPYIEPKTVQLPLGDIELRSTPDGTRDTFERVEGVWNKVSKVNSYVTKSTDNWGLGSQLNPQFGVRFDCAKENEPGAKNIDCLCNFFTSNGANRGGAWVNNANSYLELRIQSLLFTTIEELKAWLDTHELEYIYTLKTPTYTPITDQALISALDELEQLILHKGYNYITATSVNGVKAQLDLSYIKDINIVLNNMSAMIATIGGELNV